MPRSIDVSDLPEPLVEAIESIVRSFREKPATDSINSPDPATLSPGNRPIGWAKEILPELPASFFEPLPDDLLDLFEGKGESNDPLNWPQGKTK